MRRSVVLVCRLALGATFLYAAASKVPDMATFAQDLANFRLLPPALVPYAASIVVGIEVVAGLALVTGFGARAGALVAASMLVVFIGALSQALLRGIDLRCGCFSGQENATWGTVLRDVAMLLPALAVVSPAQDSNSRKHPRIGARAPEARARRAASGRSDLQRGSSTTKY
jgi:putative oxidoreductase